MNTFLGRFTLRAKILGLAAVLLAVLAVVGITAVRSLGSVEKVAGSMYDDRVVPHQVGGVVQVAGAGHQGTAVDPEQHG